MKNNKRKRLKQKARHWEMVEKRHMDELYRQALINPDTLEGQAVLSIEDLYKEESNTSKSGGLLSWLGF